MIILAAASLLISVMAIFLAVLARRDAKAALTWAKELEKVHRMNDRWKADPNICIPYKSEEALPEEKGAHDNTCEFEGAVLMNQVSPNFRATGRFIHSADGNTYYLRDDQIVKMD